MARHQARCACGAVEISFDAKPIAAASCGCDDCQAAGAALEALPGAPGFREPCGATPLVLFPKARMRVIRGAEHIARHRLREGKPTFRAYATCCNSALYIGFDKGPFWVSVMAARMPDPPAPRWRIQTRFLPVPPPDDLRNHPKMPPSLLARVMGTVALGKLTGRI